MKKIEQQIIFKQYTDDFPQYGNSFLFREVEISPDGFVDTIMCHGYGSQELKEVKNFSPQKEEKLFLIYSLFSYCDHPRGCHPGFRSRETYLKHGIVCDKEKAKSHCLKLTELLREEKNKELENERINYEILKK